MGHTRCVKCREWNLDDTVGVEVKNKVSKNIRSSYSIRKGSDLEVVDEGALVK